jgi:hypothetical protein
VKGFVLVNVAGTTAAKEAVLENSIPQTAAIDRKKATTKVEYAGEPKFEKIADTDLEYAVNMGKSVFKEGAKYYAVDQGVWYEADSPNGPWTVSVNPPKEVEKIPPSNPATTPNTSRSTRPRMIRLLWVTLPAIPAPTWTTARWSMAPATTTPDILPLMPIFHRRLPMAMPRPMTLTPSPGAMKPLILTRAPGWWPDWAPRR